MIEALEHGYHLIGLAVMVFIRQGHHLALAGEADQEGAFRVLGQDPGAGDVGGKNREGKSLGELQGDGGRIDGWGLGPSSKFWRYPEATEDAGPAPRRLCQEKFPARINTAATMRMEMMMTGFFITPQGSARRRIGAGARIKLTTRAHEPGISEKP